ncbi:MAG TPA: type VI secretion system baseplate subunit TssK [Steroidobacteraceae bacterium]|nr:type VI secretion system baseplate subunit TssK [Steroidobacteraceae bacterium]
MSDKNRVVWSEGLFLRPQHFQQQDRYLEAFVEGRTSGLRTNPWGFTELVLERDLLSTGKLGIRRAVGVFPDGTPFAIPDNDPAPPPLEVAAQIRDQVVSLALPVRQPGATLVQRSVGSRSFTRYRTRDIESRDVSSDNGAGEELETAHLNLRFVTDKEPTQDFSRIPLAHVIECRADKQVVLDERFIPSVLRLGAAPALATFLSEVQGLLYQRAEALALRAAASGRGGTAEIVEFLMLQALNRYDPWVTHVAAAATCHPEDVYQLLLQVVGELSTLTTASRRPPKFPAYEHEHLRRTFEPVMSTLRACFATQIGENVVAIPLVQKKYGVRVGTIADKSLIDNAVFIVAARADVAPEDFRRRFPAQCKIGPIERITELVNSHLPGIGLQPMPVAPRQLHNIAGSHYFEMERGTELWRSLKTSGAIALHLAGEFPGLAMECWAIRG